MIEGIGMQSGGKGMQKGEINGQILKWERTRSQWEGILLRRMYRRCENIDKWNKTCEHIRKSKTIGEDHV